MTRSRSVVVWLCAALMAASPLAPALSSQDLAPRRPVPKAPMASQGPDRRADTEQGLELRLVVKFADDVEARVEAGRVTSRRGRDLSGVQPVADLLGLRFAPLIALPEERLVDLQQRAAVRSGRAQPDLAGIMKVEGAAADVETLEGLGDALQQLDVVEYAYVQTLGAPPPGDIAPATPNLTGNQSYRGPDPGLNADFAAAAGLTGAGIRLSDCEYGWNYNHEDLVDAGIVLEPGQSINPQVWANGWGHHGTAVLGETSAVDNAYGCTGIAPGAAVYAFPEWTNEQGFRRVTAITNAIAGSSVGDVVLLEMQTGAGGPAEADPSVWTVVKAGTDAGVVVVGAAGNSNQDLDSSTYGFYQSLGDSGAIIVGAGSASTGHNKLSFSTYGSRVNVQGWGSSVFTLGYGGWATYGGDNNQKYTSTFSGTSSASPFVAAAAVLLQENAVNTTGQPLDPVALRQLLMDTGVPQGTGGHIGPFVDLQAALGGESGWTDIGFALAGLGGEPLLEGTGSLQLGTPGSLDLSGGFPLANTMLFVSLDSQPQPFMGGTLATLPILSQFLLATDGTGGLDIGFTWPAGVPSGTELFVQFAIADPFGVAGVSLSNALRGDVP